MIFLPTIWDRLRLGAESGGWRRVLFYCAYNGVGTPEEFIHHFGYLLPKIRRCR